MLRKDVQCKRKIFKTIPGTELPRCTNFDINPFVKDFEKIINLINKCYFYASSN